MTVLFYGITLMAKSREASIFLLVGRGRMLSMSFSRVSFLLFAAICLILRLNLTSAIAQADILQFEAPAQALSQTLVDFSRQLEISVATSSENLKRLETPAISMKASAGEILDVILQGTGLEARFLDGRSVVIAPDETLTGEGSEELESVAAQALLDNIIVTAKGRRAPLGATSLSISALTQDDLRFDSLGLASVDRLDQFAPSLSLRTPSGRSSTTIAMRGLSPNTTNARLQGVSVFVDGVAVSGPIASLGFSDIERIEIVRGPQSTLFGRSTYSGAIDIVTSSPSPDKVEGAVSAEASRFSVGDTPRYKSRLRVDLPIRNDSLWATFFGEFDKLDSFARTPSDSTGTGGEESRVLGGAIYGRPSDRLFFKFRYVDDRSDDEIPLVQIVHPDEWVAAGLDIETVGDGTIWPVGEVLDPQSGTTECQPAGTELGAIGRGRPLGCGLVQERTLASLIVDYQLEDYQLSYRGGYVRSDLNINSDFRPRGNLEGLGSDPFFGPGRGLPPGNKSATAFIATDETIQNTSHQIRLVSDERFRWRWLVGAYAFAERNKAYRINNFASFATARDVPRLQSRGTQRTQNLAMFGQLEWDATEHFVASIEGRYQKETIRAKPCPGCLAPTSANLKRTEYEFLPRLTLTWRPNERHTVYALYATGTKSARFNLTEPANFPGNFEDFRYVEPEKLESFEIGLKSRLLDDRLHLNAALYRQDIDDQQRTFQLDGSTAAFTDNVAESKVLGFEVEATTFLTDVLKADVAIGYADHEFLSDFEPDSLRDNRILNGRSTKGLTSVGIPKTTINLGLEYSAAIANSDYQLRVRTDAIYRSKQYADIANQAYVPESVKFNIFADIGNDNWGVSAFARNVFDERVATDTFSGASSCTYTNPEFTSFNDPRQLCLGLAVSRGREIGAALRFRF